MRKENIMRNSTIIHCKHEIVVAPTDNRGRNLLNFDFLYYNVLGSTSVTKIHVLLYRINPILYSELLELGWMSKAIHDLGQYESKVILHVTKKQVDHIKNLIDFNPNVNNLNTFRFCIDRGFTIKSGSKTYDIDSKGNITNK